MSLQINISYTAFTTLRTRFFNKKVINFYAERTFDCQISGLRVLIAALLLGLQILGKNMFENKNIDWSEVMSWKSPPKLDFVIDGLLAGTVASIVAPGATGKSFFGLELCLAVTVKDLLGLGISPDENAKAVYITAEDPKDVLESRCFHMLKHFDDRERKAVSERVEVFSIHGELPSILNNKGEIHEAEKKAIAAITELATGKRLLILDTLRKFHGGEENDSGHMTRLTQILDQIAHNTKCAIMFLHHSNKGGNNKEKGGDQSASRGSTALVDNIRFQLNLVKMTEDERKAYGLRPEQASSYVKVVGAKTNYREKNHDFWLKRGDGGVLMGVKLEPVKQGRYTNK